MTFLTDQIRGFRFPANWEIDYEQSIVLGEVTRVKKKITTNEARRANVNFFFTDVIFFTHATDFAEKERLLVVLLRNH